MDGTNFRPLLGLTVSDHDFSARQKAAQLTAAPVILGQPIVLKKTNFALKGNFKTASLAVEVWGDEVVDKFFGRALFPLAGLDTLDMNAFVTSTIHIPGPMTENACSTVIGKTQGLPGFKARVVVKVVRTSPRGPATITTTTTTAKMT